MNRKIVAKPMECILFKMMYLFVPERLIECFDVCDIVENKFYFEIELREKVKIFPNNNIKMNGFLNPISVLSFAFSRKPVYLKIYRRRFQYRHNRQAFYHEYRLSVLNMKMLPEVEEFFLTKLKDKSMTVHELSWVWGISYKSLYRWYSHFNVRDSK